MSTPKLLNLSGQAQFSLTTWGQLHPNGGTKGLIDKIIKNNFDHLQLHIQDLTNLQFCV